MGGVRNQNKVGERNTCTLRLRVSYTREQGEVSLRAKLLSWDPSTDALRKLWVRPPVLHKGSVMVHTCNPSTWEVNEGRNHKFKFILSFPVKGGLGYLIPNLSGEAPTFSLVSSFVPWFKINE